MGDSGRSSPFFRFGVYEADLRAGELRKKGVKLKLQEQPFQMLAMLLEHAGEVVTREELRSRVWPEDTFVDFDHAVSTAITKIRVALGDDAENPRFIETIPRRGYRFIASVSAPKTSGDGVPSAQVSSSVPGRSRSGLATRRRALLPGLLALSLVIALILFVSYWRSHTAEHKIRSLAVLPLENLSGDANQEYFVDGMTDELTTNLAKIKSLRVISRTSAMQYKNVRKPLADIARSLHVDAVVQGSILRSGDKLRITVQLVDARTDRHLWAEDYNRDLRDVVAVQGEVARRIAEEIRTTLTAEERAELTSQHQVNPEAYEAYLRGRYFWNTRTEEGMKKAIAYFNQSMGKDPNNPLAYDGVADCWLSLGWYGYLSPQATFPQTKAAAMKALELDATLGEAHASLAMASMNYDWDWSAAEREFRKAIELNPNYANAHHWYADYLSAVGRHDDAIKESKRAVELDPISPIINAWLGWRYFFARQYDVAIEQYLKTLEMDPTFVPAHLVLGQGYEQKSMPKKAVDELKKAVSLSGGSSVYVSSLAHAYAIAGRRREAEMLLRQLNERAQHTYVAPFHIAIIYAGLGQKDQALAWLEKGYQERCAGMVWLKVDPRLDVLRSDPRFQDLLRRIGLPQ